jgi:phosphatidylglycerophosphate synthase
MLPKKNWGKLAAMLTFLGIIVAMLFGIYAIPNIDNSLRYFAITLVLLFAIFVYFEFLKEYPQ